MDWYFVYILNYIKMESLIEKFDTFELGFSTKDRRAHRAKRRAENLDKVSDDTSTDTEDNTE